MHGHDQDYNIVKEIEFKNVNKELKTLKEKAMEKAMNQNLVKNIKRLNFKPPEFGITVLGCSHGFDPKGSTSGYIIWINGK